MVETLNSETVENLTGFIKILMRLMHSKSFLHEPEQKSFRFFFWRPGSDISEDVRTPITFFLSFLNIYFIRREGSIFHYRHNKKNIHIEAKLEGDKFRISAHIDNTQHTDVLYNNFTSKLLSSLSFFLQLLNKKSQITFFSPIYTRTNQLEELQREPDDLINLVNFEDEPIYPSQQEQVVIFDDAEVISHESLKEERIRKSRESVERNLKIYKLKIQKRFEEKILKDLERREKEQKDAWRKEAQSIIKIVLGQGTAQLLSDKEFILNSVKIQKTIKHLIDEYLEKFDQETHGLLRSEFKKVCNNFFPKIFREKEKLLHQERKKYWEIISTQIIERGFEEIYNNSLSKRKFQLDRESVRFKINELGNNYYTHLIKSDKPYFKTCFEAVARDSFSKSLLTTQELLNAREEEHNKIQQKIQIRVDEFYKKMYSKIKSKALRKGELVEEEIRGCFIDSFEDWVVNSKNDISYSEICIQQFENLLTLRINNYIQKITSILSLEKETTRSFNEYGQNRGVFVSIVIITGALIVFFLWYFNLHYLVQWEIFAKNLWIPIPIALLIVLDFILICLLFN